MKKQKTNHFGSAEVPYSKAKGPRSAWLPHAIAPHFSRGRRRLHSPPPRAPQRSKRIVSFVFAPTRSICHPTRKRRIPVGTLDNQMYYCKDCKRKFKDDDSLYGGRVPAEYVSSALSMYYRGMSVADICEQLNHDKGYHPSKSVVFKWIEKHTDNAVKLFDRYKPNVGDAWVADETVINLDGKDVWLWDIIDVKTRFLLASKLSYSSNMSDAVTLFELAKQRAGKSPKEIRTDKLPAYPDAIYKVFGDATFLVLFDYWYYSVTGVVSVVFDAGLGTRDARRQGLTAPQLTLRPCRPTL